MKKFHFFLFKLKRNTISIFLLIFMVCLVLFSKSNMQAAKSGLKLWANSIVPSFLPFFIATECLSRTNMPYIFAKIFNPIMNPLFNVSGIGSFALIMGILSGYPVGAKIAVDFRNNNLCSKEECERLLSFTNNSGPLFIVGTCGVSLFGSSLIGFLLFFTHILGMITVGYIFKFWKKNSPKNTFTKTNSSQNKLQNINFNNLGEVLGSSIKNAISSTLMIGGFIVLFSVIISILSTSGIINFITKIFAPICSSFNLPDQIISSLLTGILEITNGISLISAIKLKKISINIILTAFLLGTGGISILLQVLSITSKSDLSIKPYIFGKILHGLIAAFYIFIAIQVFPMFNFNLM